METQAGDADDVESGDPRDLKAFDHHAEDIVAFFIVKSEVLGLDPADGEVEKVENDEDQNDGAGNHHRAGSDGGAGGIFFFILLTVSSAIANRNCDSRPDMEDDDGEKAEAKRP